MQSLKEDSDSIQLLTDIAKSCGLEINKKKSNVLIFNTKDQPDEIGGIPVSTKINYLGVTIQNKRDCFKLHRTDSINKAKKYSNLMPAVIARSCNKLLIGKTYWKSAALPSILHGSDIIFYKKKQLDAIQKEENKAYRYTVNAHSKTAISGLRGEMGSSLQATRDMKAKILFIKHALDHNRLLREIVLHQCEEKKASKWMNLTKKYMGILHLNINLIEMYSVRKIKQLIQEYDSKIWREDVVTRSTLSLYCKYKQKVNDEQRLYDNSPSTTTLFRARTGMLQLNEKNRYKGEDTTCDLCKQETETIGHFLLECTSLNSTRTHIIDLQRPYQENVDSTLAQFLLFGDVDDDTIARNRDDIQKLWKHRNAILSNI